MTKKCQAYTAACAGHDLHDHCDLLHKGQNPQKRSILPNAMHMSKEVCAEASDLLSAVGNRGLVREPLLWEFAELLGWAYSGKLCSLA